MKDGDKRKSDLSVKRDRADNMARFEMAHASLNEDLSTLKVQFRTSQSNFRDMQTAFAVLVHQRNEMVNGAGLIK